MLSILCEQQVDEWYPELMDIEEQAKLVMLLYMKCVCVSVICAQKADVLLFVVDNRTRAVASMVEASYFAGKVLLKL